VAWSRGKSVCPRAIVVKVNATHSAAKILTVGSALQVINVTLNSEEENLERWVAQLAHAT
jgi:hypothetical protein